MPVGRPPKRNSALLPFTGDVAPSEATGVPSCPKELDAIGKKKWRETVKVMLAFGTLNKSTRDMLQVYCAAFSRRQEAEAKVKELGAILTSTQGGLYRSPWLDVMNQAVKEMTTLSKMLGLDPMTQKRLGIKIVTETVKKVSARDRSKSPKNAGTQ